MALWTTARFGGGLSPDSVHYVAAARHLLSDGKLNGYDGEPFVAWPPLFPVLLALPGWAGVDALSAARWINALSFGVTILLAGIWLDRHTGSAVLGLIGGLCALLTVPLFEAAVMVWSEAVFIALTLGSLAVIASLDRGLSPVKVFMAAMLAGLAFLTRHMGFAMVLAGTACVLFVQGAPRKHRMVLAAAFLIVSAAPATAWIFWNQLSTGAIAGERGPADQTLLQNAITMGRSLVQCLVIDGYAQGGRRNAVVTGLFMGGLMIGPVWALRAMKRSGGSALYFPILSMAVFANLYVYSLFVLSLRVPMDRINTRLLAPVLAPVILLILSIVHHCWCLAWASQSSGRNSGRVAAALGSAMLITILVMSGLRVGQRVQGGVSEGVSGFNTREWRESETLAFLRRHQPAAAIISNWPDAVYALTGRTARLSPRRTAGFHDDRIVGPADIQRLLRSCNQGGAVYLVWHKPNHRDYLYRPDELGSICELKLVRAFSDGAVYACYGRRVLADGHREVTGHPSHEHVATARQHRVARP